MKWQNKVQLIGYLGRDPDIRLLPSGLFFAILRLATANGFTRKDRERVTTWHTVKVWGRKPEYIRNCFIRGSHVLVDGKIEYRTYLNKEGVQCRTTLIRATRIMNLDR
jgi:single-strand DNA-binding protein